MGRKATRPTAFFTALFVNKIIIFNYNNVLYLQNVFKFFYGKYLNKI